MVVLTGVYIIAIAYANITSSYASDSSDNGKLPLYYGVWKSYYAEKMEMEPEEWYALEELGIILSEQSTHVEKETYIIRIVDEEKALAWMEYGEFTPQAFEYEEEFFQIFWSM